jgi:hypothetical protein
VLNETLAAITGILVLAALSEALVEYLFAPIVDARASDETMQPGASSFCQRLDNRIIRTGFCRPK